MEDDLDILEQMEQGEAPVKKKGKKEKEDDNVVRTSFIEDDKYILEQIKNTTTPTHTTHITEGVYEFIKYNKDTGTIEKVKDYEMNGKVYKPIVDDIVQNSGVLLPTDIEEYKTPSEITDQIREFLKKNIELPSFYEKFLPNLALFYWVYESFPFVPYVQFVGRTATGKSTAMEVFGSICYKPINTTGSLTIASVFRVATNWKGTLLIDEFEKAGENSREMISFLKSGVSDNLVLRTEGEVRKEVKAYVVKAPKIFTSENPINDAGLQSRTMVIKMEKNKKPIPLFRLPHYYKEAQEIRNKLLLWRFRNLNKINLEEIEFGFDELKAFDRRVQQVITPIFYFSDDETKKSILEFAKEQEEETQRERRESLHGTIFETIYELYSKEVIPTIAEIHKEINPAGTKYPVSEKKIGRVVRTILGFEIKRLGDQNISTVILDGKKDKIEELRAYYGITPPSVTSVVRVDDVVKEKETF